MNSALAILKQEPKLRSKEKAQQSNDTETEEKVDVEILRLDGWGFGAVLFFSLKKGPHAKHRQSIPSPGAA